MKTVSTLLLALSLSIGLQAQSTITDNINVDGLNRTYRLRIPPAATSGDLLPLIVSLHGFTETASIQESNSGMNAIADTAGVFVVYPNGTNVLLFLQGWNDLLDGSGVDDVGFIDALISDLVANYPIDPDRVFATGFSAGGGMTVALGCALSNRIKAIAPVAAAINPANASLCSPATFRPLLQIHGTADAVVPYTGAAGTIFYPATAPAEAFFRAWIQSDGCPAPVIGNVPNTVPGDGSTVTFASLNDCSSGNSYRFYLVIGGDHSIPGPGGKNKDLYSSAAIWDFFRSQGGAAPRKAATVQASENLIASPNPAADQVVVQTGLEGEWMLQVHNLQGQLVHFQNGRGAQVQLSVALWQNGLYQVAIQSTESGSQFHSNTPLQILH